jgi:DNA (cytosine-5)-methyltransferase 1
MEKKQSVKTKGILKVAASKKSQSTIVKEQRGGKNEGAVTQINSFRTVSLFSGAGGLDLGLSASGFEILFANDIDEHSCKTLALGNASLHKNWAGKVVCSDIKNLSGEIIHQAVGRDKITLLAGGPPCQAFSIFGRRKGRTDPRGQMVDEYFRILAELSPDVFLFENVFGLLTVDKGDVYRLVCDKLARPSDKLNYEIKVFRLNAVNYGVPQFRDRIIIIGSQTGKIVTHIPQLTYANPSEGQLGYRTVTDALRHLPCPNNESPKNHMGRVHGVDILHRYGTLKPGQRDTHTRINKLDLTKPSFTIVCGSDCGGGKGHVHPTQPREVTPRESARIQTFPDYWKFDGKGRYPIRQVGNAVPPMLAFAIGNAIREQILDLPPIPLKSGIRFLKQEHLFPELFKEKKHGQVQC